MVNQKALLTDLASSGLVLVAGSWARGQQHEGSDIDFYIKVPRRYILYGGRNENVEKVIELLRRHGVRINSTRTGYLSTIGETGNDLKREMEFYDDFSRNKNRLPSVEIMGVNFKTR